MIGLEEDHARHEEVEVRRAERACEAHVAAGVRAGADEVDVGAPVDLDAAQEEGVDAALGSAVE